LQRFWVIRGYRREDRDWLETLHIERAAVLLGATAALNHRAQFSHNPEDIAEFEQHVAAIRAALDVTTFDALFGVCRAWFARLRDPS
jgi:hypothetical protein